MMGKFTVEIDVGNDAMRTRHDIAQALLELAAKLVSNTYVEALPVKDSNGKTVGRALFPRRQMLNGPGGIFFK